MIFFLIKNWKLLLDIILVVGGIIALTLFDPFGIFTNTKLRGTANLVSSVKSIGELVTAEYYGEVIASLHETKIYNVEPDVLYDNFESCYYILKDIVVSKMLDSDEKRRFLFFKQSMVKEVENSGEFEQLKQEYNANNVYTHLIVFLAVNNLGGQQKDYFNEVNNKLKQDTEKQVLKSIIDELTNFIKNQEAGINDITTAEMKEFVFSTPSYFNEISDFHYKLNKGNELSRKNRKKDIVFIGRGWVKAGFRFDQFDESNFYYDKELKLIRFYGLSPCILDKDINPWFIPERKIKGFELVDFYKKATFEEAKMVKKKCKEKLLAQAEKADILTLSKENGEVALTNFFSLLLDESELTVELIDFPFEKEYQMIIADSLITVEEALSIDKIYSEVKNNTVNLSASEISRNKRLFKMFMNRLMKLPFVNKDVQFNLFSLEAAKVLEHRLFVTCSDYEKMKVLRASLILDHNGQISTAYMSRNPDYMDGYTSFTSDFNQMMSLIDIKMAEVYSLRTDTLLIDPARFRKLELNDSTLVEKVEMLSGTDTIYKILHKDLNFKFSDLRYPIVTLHQNDFNGLGFTDTTKVDSIIRESIIKTKGSFTSGDDNMTEILNNEFEVIEKFKSDSIIYNIKVGPVRAFTKSIKNLFN